MFRPPSFDMSLLYPFMYSHDAYGNIVDKMHKRTQVSWSFYMQNGNGKMVVVRSQPILTEYYPQGNCCCTRFGQPKIVAALQLRVCKNYLFLFQEI